MRVRRSHRQGFAEWGAKRYTALDFEKSFCLASEVWKYLETISESQKSCPPPGAGDSDDGVQQDSPDRRGMRSDNHDDSRAI